MIVALNIDIEQIARVRLSDGTMGVLASVPMTEIAKLGALIVWREDQTEAVMPTIWKDASGHPIATIAGHPPAKIAAGGLSAGEVIIK